MTTYAPSDINSKPLPAGQGEAVIYDGKISMSAAAADADVLRFCRIPAGTRLTDVNVNVSTKLSSSTVPSSMRLTPCDGSSATTLVSAGDTVFATVQKKSMAFDPVTVEKDSFLEFLLGTVAATAAAGVVSVAAHGMANGAA